MQARAGASGGGIDVVVVGGGVAGLCAATRLLELGASVTLVEARPVLGGRVSTFDVAAVAGRADNGQHILMGCYRETFSFLRRVGASSRVSLQRGLALHSVSTEGRWSHLACPALPAPFNLLAGLWRWNALTWPDRLSALRLSMRGTPRPTETVKDWLKRLGQTPRLIEMLWEPLAVAALNQPIDVAAAAPFAQVIDRMLEHRDGASLALAQAPLEDLFAGPARSFMERRGGLVRTQAPARLTFEGEAPSVYVGGERVPSRAAIVAVEWNALERLCPQPPPSLAPIWRAAADTAASPIVSAHLWLDRRVLDVPVVGLPRRPWQWVFDVGSGWGLPNQLSLSASAASGMPEWSNDALIQSALTTIREALPRARDAGLVHAVVVRERRATFSVAPGAPPRPGNETAVPGFFLAGDWIGTSLPATIEAAAASGHAAAGAAARYLSL
jgi:squalene-associated FAD-dependent desaturase